MLSLNKLKQKHKYTFGFAMRKRQELFTKKSLNVKMKTSSNRRSKCEKKT